MMKVNWEVYTQPEKHWIRVLKAKYNYGDGLFPTFHKGRNTSNLWRGICGCWEYVKSNTIWKIGNGNSTLFWTDVWVPKVGILQPFAVSALSDFDLCRPVSLLALLHLKIGLGTLLSYFLGFPHIL